MKDVLGNHLKEPSFHLVHWLMYYPISAKDQSKNPSIWKESFTMDCSSDTHSTRGEFGRADVLVADLEELETINASEIYSE